MKLRFIIFLTAAFAVREAFGATIRVPGDHATIQRALDAARGGDTVLVAPGEYPITEPLSFNRLHDRADPRSPPLKDIALVSEAGARATTILMSAPADPNRASVFVFEKGETMASRIEGFTITGGAGTLTAGQAAGGGIFLSGSSSTLKDCVISGNGVFQRGIGGGIYCENESLTKLEDCVIAGNFAEERGGALEVRGANLVLARCLILGNWTRGTGGGIYVSTTAFSQLERCVIAGNAASFAGGIQVNGRVVADHCTMTANSAVTEGGGVVCNSAFGGVSITNSIFWRNEPASLLRCRPTHDLTDEDPLFVLEPLVDPLRVRTAMVAGEEQVLPDFFVVEGDYHLMAGSLAIDRGDLEFPKDADGTRTDLGAFAFFQTTRRPPGRLLVDASDQGEFTTIQAALDASIDGDEIIVRPGVYAVQNALDYRSRIVTLRSEAGPGETIIRRSPSPDDPENGNVCVFESLETPDTVLDGFTLTGGDAVNGGGILVRSSSPTIRNCWITGNRAVDGGGVALQGGASLVGCTVSRNAGRRGGGLSVTTGATITRCRIAGNAAEEGGGIYASSSAVLTSCFIAENRADLEGGGVYAGGDVLFDACTISGNVAAQSDGGLAVARGVATLTSCIVWNNLGALGRSPSSFSIAMSCVQGDSVWPGPGNINQDPLFAAWTGAATVHVDPAAIAPGDGSPQAPYPDLVDGLEGYSLLLAAGSPCLGAGRNGGNMGADDGSGVPSGERRRLLKLAPGSYSLSNASLAHFVSVVGSGAEATALEGPVLGLRSTCSLESLSVTASKGSAVVALHGETAVIRRSTIRSMDSRSPGLHGRVGASVVLEDCLLTGCPGGALLFHGSSLVMDGCVVSRNGDPERRPIAITLGGSTALVRECDISENLAQPLSLFSEVSIESTRVADNAGPGFTAKAATAVISNCSFVRNHGLECVDSNVRITGTSILNSAGTGLTTRGSSLDIEGCTIAGNDGFEVGGGLHATGSGTISIVNTLVAGNFALLRGGGLAFEGSGSHSVMNSTIHGNGLSSSARADPETSAIYCAATVSLTNCIVSENRLRSFNCMDIRTCLLDSDPLYVRPGTFDFDLFTRVTVLDLELGYPGFILDLGDYHLTAGSPAIDAGTLEGAPSSDLEGTPRPCGAGVDVGAYESTECSGGRQPFRRGDANADGAPNLTDAVMILLHLFQGGPPPSCLKSADTDDTGVLNLTDAVHLLGHLFTGGPAPLAPFSSCGTDPTPDGLACKAFVPCS